MFGLEISFAGLLVIVVVIWWVKGTKLAEATGDAVMSESKILTNVQTARLGKSKAKLRKDLSKAVSEINGLETEEALRSSLGI